MNIPEDKRLRLLVAIPCLNEAKTIAQVVSEVPRTIAGVYSVDILVVDDGSEDATSTEAKLAGAEVLRHPRNRGVGTAFQSAVNYAVENRYDLMINIDGDRQFNPGDIPKLVAPIVAGEADMVTASRFIDPAMTPDMPKIKLYGNHMMSSLISGLVRKKFADVSCGFRCYSRESLLQINLHGAFTYTQETFLDFAAKRLEIKEIPIDVQYFADRTSRVAGSISKYAVNTSKIIFRGYRDYFPLRFFWGISAVFAVPATIFSIVFVLHYLMTGAFTGYLFAGFTAAFLYSLATVFFVLGIVTDMLDRIRSNQERILYMLKKSPNQLQGKKNVRDIRSGNLSDVTIVEQHD
ncbi:glycosyltransferase family 2 protein [Pseudomonas abietaniphila]|uniref:Glycosyltransferase involved in cell wall bisynthesis n=1 Tax=Pseudomonas abietaniphila TaxID=89065 RepID=A0A1G8BRG0_9PSED|nr:glycosyltransferase family 2 protein [Pseudomonas abietaniphila]SDH35698.1 Glycosyltransferase involved in cell wall bisynthesis [Pseudomonas abietaniphila]